MAIAKGGMAMLRAEQAKCPEAEAEFGQTINILGRTLGPNHPQTLIFQVILGKLYTQLGKGALAEPLFRHAAELGISAAQNQLGYLYQNGTGIKQSYKEALKWFIKSADQGDAEGQNNVGFFYDHGFDVGRDLGQAMKWYQRAAEQGYGPAQNNIGFMYSTGHGVSRNYDEALKWYRLSVEQGHPDDPNAYINLGDLHESGLGVSIDRVEAYKWYSLAAEQSSDAQKKMNALAGQLSPGQLAEAKRRASEWRANH